MSANIEMHAAIRKARMVADFDSGNFESGSRFDGQQLNQSLKAVKQSNFSALDADDFFVNAQAITLGGGVRVEVRSGAPAPVAVAAEAGVDLTSRFTPFGLGLRLGRSTSHETMVNLELVLEWR